MTVQVRADYTNYAFILSGSPYSREAETIAQDAGRSAALAPFTVMALNPATNKWVPLTDVAPALTSAFLVCGANGGNLAAWQAVSDGEFSFTVDGEVINVTGIDTSSITALTQIVDILQNAVIGKANVYYDVLNDTFRFESKTQGTLSTITVLSAVSGGSGTDISGASFLNGASGTGTATQGTGGGGVDIPQGIYLGGSITAAELVAGDVVNRPILIGGACTVDSSLVVLENSLAVTDIVEARNETIRGVLASKGIFLEDTIDADELEN
jgi:hypothetical protein